MQDNLVVGGLYSVASGNGAFSVIKILALAPEVAHIRIYKNKYESRPQHIDPTTLSLGSPLQDQDFGIGHAPLSRVGFAETWQPVLLLQTAISDDELTGYRLWQSSQEEASAHPWWQFWRR